MFRAVGVSAECCEEATVKLIAALEGLCAAGGLGFRVRV